MTDQTQRKSLDDLYSSDPAPAAQSEAGELRQDAPQAEAAKAEPTEQPPAKDAPPASKSDVPAGMVPLNAFDAVRTENKDLKRRLEALEKRAPQTPVPQPKRIDPLVDPDGWQAEQERTFQKQRFDDRLDLTTEIVIRDVGEDKWAEAEQALVAACNADERFADAVADHITKARNPAKAAYDLGIGVIEHNRRRDPNYQREARRAELKALLEEIGYVGPQAQAAPPASPSQRPAQIPTSLAGVTSAAARTPGARPIKRRSIDELYST
jgi:phage-related minor tail protein